MECKRHGAGFRWVGPRVYTPRSVADLYVYRHHCRAGGLRLSDYIKAGQVHIQYGGSEPNYQ